MANYEFECELDGIYERQFSIGTAPETVDCPVCKDPMARKISTFRPIFKGSGWGGDR